MITLENDYLSVTLNEFGAELTSVIDRSTNYEFIWQANPDFWGRHAPVLFPIVGKLKGNQYQYQGEMFEMTQHGFARDSLFEVVEKDKHSVLFRLTSNDETKGKYPFDFELLIQYTLKRKNVVTKYKVTNPSGTEDLYYGIGGHPAFNVSQKETETGEKEFDQVSFEIKPASSILHFPLSEDGLIKAKDAVKVISEEVHLTHESFQNDALIYQIDDWKSIELNDCANNVTIGVQTANLPYVGIWSPYPARASFVCIEPWAGIADTEDTSGQYDEKLGINKLEPTKEQTHEFCMSFIKSE